MHSEVKHWQHCKHDGHHSSLSRHSVQCAMTSQETPDGMLHPPGFAGPPSGRPGQYMKNRFTVVRAWDLAWREKLFAVMKTLLPLSKRFPHIRTAITLKGGDLSIKTARNDRFYSFLLPISANRVCWPLRPLCHSPPGLLSVPGGPQHLVEERELVRSVRFDLARTRPGNFCWNFRGCIRISTSQWWIIRYLL